VHIGVLALQGDFAAHLRALADRGVTGREVRGEADLADVDGIVLPGGESTTVLSLLRGTSLEAALVQRIASGTPVLATCAGLILLAREVRNPRQDALALLDVTVERNAYGRQRDSVVLPLQVEDPAELGSDTLEGVFIRAPRIVATGGGVKVLARRDGDPVLVRQGRILAATFHPELSPASPVIHRFLALCGGAP